MGTWLPETCRDLEWTYDGGMELWVKLVFYKNGTQVLCENVRRFRQGYTECNNMPHFSDFVV